VKYNVRIVSLGILALLAFGGGIWAYEYHSRPERAVEKYKRELIAAGEKLTIPEVLPEPLPADRNGVGIFLHAQPLVMNRRSLLGTNSPLAMRMVAPGRALVGWAQPDVRDDTTNSWEEVNAAAAVDEEALADLAKIIELPALDFQLNYNQGFSLLLPNLSQLKGTVQRLSAAAICDVHDNNPQQALLKLRTMLALVKGMEDERLIISQLVRVSMNQITMSATWEFLQSPQVTDAQLAELERDWLALSFLRGAENALVMERAMSETTLARMRQSSAEFRNVATGFSTRAAASSGAWWEQAGASALMVSRESVWRFAWSYPDELKALHGHQAVIKASRMASGPGGFKTALDEQEKSLAALGLETKKSDSETLLFDFDDMNLKSLFSHSVLSLQRFLNRIMVADVSKELTTTAIALKRYESKHNGRAPDLAALIPEYLPRLPRDPVDGKALRYVPARNGFFVLYSVGADGVDDGGNPASTISDNTPVTSATLSRRYGWQNGKDYVWPQPASAEQQEAYYKIRTPRRTLQTVAGEASRFTQAKTNSDSSTNSAK
jgi:hypothetical protein